MAEITLREIHEDLEALKRDVGELKEALLGDEGELTELAKERIASYVKAGPKKAISQKEIEKEFL